MTLTLPAENVAGESGPRPVPVERPAATSRRVPVDRTPDIVEVWGRDSFPASDAPANR